MNHFAHKCRANPRGLKSRVSAVHEAVDMEDDPYYIGAITKAKTEVQFQIDTGSQCDILPAQGYK